MKKILPILLVLVMLCSTAFAAGFEDGYLTLTILHA